jgi:hypothetical protein
VEFAGEIEAGQALAAAAQAAGGGGGTETSKGIHGAAFAKKNPAQRPGSSYQRDGHGDQHVG